MKYYVGEGDEEKQVPLCGYNFQYIDGKYYGYGQALDTLPIEQFEGVALEDEQTDNVLVVYLAHNKDGRRCIVGWYKDATVYRHAQTETTLDSERLNLTYSFVAPAKKSLLLPVEERQYFVEHKELPIWIEPASIVTSDIVAYIHNYAGDQMNLVLTQEELQKSLSLSMDYERYFYKADEFLAKDCYAKAIRCFNKAIKEAPEETLGFECKGSILLSLKMYKEAKKAYQEVLKRDDENTLAYYCLGLLHGLTKEYEEALACYKRYLSERAEDVQAQAECALIYYLIGETQKAEVLIAETLQQDAENSVVKAISERIKNK